MVLLCQMPFDESLYSFNVVVVLCCFQTNLPLAALPLWWWYLYNCASATCRRGMTKRQAASSQLINNLAAFAHRGRSQTVEFYSTWERCRWVIKPKRCCRWELQLWNSKRWLRGKAASGKLVWNQHYSTALFIYQQVALLLFKSHDWL